jgi:NAD(P)-dependent dehydrogenase (short-subunit alcohol dehydrogenase family)
MSISISLEGKVALVTGASRGIGLAISKTYAQAGATVVMVSRKEEELASAFQELAKVGKGSYVAANVGYEQDIERIVEFAMNQFGRVDILVNNAGTNPHFGPLMDISVSAWDKIMDVNLKAPLLLSQKVVSAWMANNGGRIINMASVGGIKAMPYIGAYNISKAGLIMLTKQLAQELGPLNITVNALAPGVIKTRFARALWENEYISSEILKQTPLGRHGEPEDVAGIALFLASDYGSYVNGAVIAIDGGELA